MAEKNCPKCGEQNPGDAIMCWSCYAPLTGRAVASGLLMPAPTRAATAEPATDYDEKEPRRITPAVMGALAVVALVAVAIGLKTFTGLSAPRDDIPPIQEPTPENTNLGGDVPSIAARPEGPAKVPPPAAVPFEITALPNPRSDWGTMAIVPTQENLGETQAAALAAFTLRRYTRKQIRRWNGMYIFVFKDKQTADAYNNYMRGRRGATLTASDYQNLIGIWPRTLVRYEYYKQRESVVYPSKNINGWWLAGTSRRT